jgi:hypothetical protein
MEKITVTIITTYRTNKIGEHLDEFPEIVAIGYDEENAFWEALKALKYAACRDFTRASSFEKGHAADWTEAEGVIIGEDDDPDEIARELWDDDACVYTFNGQQIVTSMNGADCCTGSGTILSDDIRRMSSIPCTLEEYRNAEVL